MELFEEERNVPIRVLCRIRPLNQAEQTEEQRISILSSNAVSSAVSLIISHYLTSMAVKRILYPCDQSVTLFGPSMKASLRFRAGVTETTLNFFTNLAGQHNHYIGINFFYNHLARLISYNGNKHA